MAERDESIGGLMHVSSASLLRAARSMRIAEVPHAILRNGVVASPEQLEAAAQILSGGPKSQITSGSTDRAAHELPGWIDREQQEDPEVLFFARGILSPGGPWRIARDGTVTEVGP